MHTNNLARSMDPPLRRNRRSGFTVVELMVVVIVIAMLAVIAFPAWAKSRRSAQNTQFINDLRIAVHAIELFTLDAGDYPVDQGPGVTPPGMDAFLQGMKFNAKTPLGGRWEWDYERNGVVAGVGVFLPEADTQQMRDVDRRIDDGNLATGFFLARSDTQGYVYAIESD